MVINKILAIRNDRFGEFLLNIPALCELKQNYPNAKLTLAVDTPVQQLARRITSVDEVIVWESRKHTLAEIKKFSKELQRKKYDLCVIFNPRKESHIISFLAGIPLRAGYNRKWGFLLNRKMEDRKSLGLRHEVGYNLELLKTVGIDSLASDREFPLEIENEDFPDSRLTELGIGDRDFIAVHPWASNREKEWPVDNYRELAKRIHADFGMGIVLIGGAEEKERAEKFCAGLNIVNMTGETTLIELAGLLKKAKILITNDSGPMHLAAVVGTPAVAIFRKNPASVSARRWGPAGNNHIVIEYDDLARIELKEVLNGVKKILG